LVDADVTIRMGSMRGDTADNCHGRRKEIILASSSKTHRPAASPTAAGQRVIDPDLVADALVTGASPAHAS
jgi:hypothetical protein